MDSSGVLRATWLMAVVQLCQRITDVIALDALAEREGALQKFVRFAPPPRTPLERLIYQGAIAQITLEALKAKDRPASRRLRVDDHRIRAAVRLIDDALYHNVNLSEAGLAARLGLSGSHFSRLFAKSTGTRFRSYVNAVRVNAATSLLADDVQSVKQVAAAVGYRTVGELDRHFKQVTGLTPTAYRAKKIRTNSKNSPLIALAGADPTK
jgi:AraC-like DNA-binding protein